MPKKKTPLRIKLEKFFNNSLSDNKLIFDFETKQDINCIRSQVSNLKHKLQTAEKAVVVVDTEHKAVTVYKEPEKDYVKPLCCKKKTPLRLKLEDFFNNKDLGECIVLDYNTEHDLSSIRSLISNLRKNLSTAEKAVITVYREHKQVYVYR